jgi:hypothetical protein
MPKLLPVVEELASENSQADPQLRTGKVYTRVTGNSLRLILSDSLGVLVTSLHSPRTLQRSLLVQPWSLLTRSIVEA